MVSCVLAALLFMFYQEKTRKKALVKIAFTIFFFFDFILFNIDTDQVI